MKKQGIEKMKRVVIIRLFLLCAYLPALHAGNHAMIKSSSKSIVGDNKERLECVREQLRADEKNSKWQAYGCWTLSVATGAAALLCAHQQRLPQVDLCILGSMCCTLAFIQAGAAEGSAKYKREMIESVLEGKK